MFRRQIEQVLPMPLRHLADRWRDFPLSPYNAITRRTPLGVVCDPPRTKVVIYGAGHGREEAPLEDATWAVWALNLVAPIDAQRRLRADAWFDLHQRLSQTADDLRWIAACPFPIYLPEDLQDASPRAVRYPLDLIEAKFGSYFACTFAYQIALAMFNGATDIGLYGVELMWGTSRERTVEWANTAYWLGRAEERGIRIHLPHNSLLGRHFARYGLEYTKELDATQRYVDHQDKMDDLRRQAKSTAGMGG